MYFVLFEMIVLKTLFLLTEKVFNEIFPFERIILLEYSYLYGM